MKKLFLKILIVLLFSSCSSEETSQGTVENTAPGKPFLIAPVNNNLCIDNSVNFKWEPVEDLEGDELTYEIQISTDNAFNQIEKTIITPEISSTISLQKGIAYYWRVKAIDERGNSSEFSSIYNFYTEGDEDINRLPFSPSLIRPELNSSTEGSTIALEWNASDVDVEDELSYDVFFGTNNPPITKVSNHQSSTQLDLTIESSKKYYWRVVVYDNNGGETIGQVWNFSTE